MFGHHVRPYGEIGRTISKFGRTMSDDRLLFPALLQVTDCHVGARVEGRVHREFPSP